MVDVKMVRRFNSEKLFRMYPCYTYLRMKCLNSNPIVQFQYQHNTQFTCYKKTIHTRPAKIFKKLHRDGNGKPGCLLQQTTDHTERRASCATPTKPRGRFQASVQHTHTHATHTESAQFPCVCWRAARAPRKNELFMSICVCCWSESEHCI